MTNRQMQLLSVVAMWVYMTNEAPNLEQLRAIFKWSKIDTGKRLSVSLERLGMLVRSGPRFETSRLTALGVKKLQSTGPHFAYLSEMAEVGHGE